MTAFLCLLYCVMNWATWRLSETDRQVYIGRAAVSALFFVYLWEAKDLDQVSPVFVLPSLVLVVLELLMFVFAIEARDPRLYGEQK
jgi:hypothetical protein